MSCHKNTRSSRINLSNGCNPCNPCNLCNRCACECQCDTPDYCEDGCLTIQPSDCSTYSGENIICANINKGDTITEVIQKLASKICNCCDGDTPSTCVPLSVSISNITQSSYRINITGLNVGEKYSISTNGGVSYIVNNLTTSFYTVTGAAPGTLYSIVVKKVLADDTFCITTTEVSTSAGCIPLVINFTMIGETSMRLNVSGLSSGDLYKVSLDGGSTFPYNGISTSYLDITGLTASTLYNVVVARIVDSEALPCETETTVSTIPCPNITINTSLHGVAGPYDPITETTPFRAAWNAVPGALSYKVIDPVNGIDIILSSSTTSYLYGALPGVYSPDCKIYAELPYSGYCSVVGYFINLPVMNGCSQLSNLTMTSTTSNAYGPIFNVGWGCTSCTGVTISYREQAPGATWTNLGSFGTSGTATITPTISNPFKFNTIYQVKIKGNCDGNGTVRILTNWGVDCTNANFAVTGTPSTSGVDFTFTEFSSNIDDYLVSLSGSPDILFTLLLGVGSVRTGTFTGPISSGSHSLTLTSKIDGISKTCPVLSVTV